MLIQTPSSATVLVDGGPGPLTLANGLARHLPLFKTDLDLLVIASPRDDFVGALPELLDRYHPRRELITRAPGRSTAYRALRQKLIEHDIPIDDAGTLPTVDLGGGLSLTDLADDVDSGSVLRLTWDQLSLVMAPMLAAEAEQTLVNRALAAPTTTLLLANSGSSESTSESWVRALNPRLVLISVGAGNPDGNPTIEVLGRLARRDVVRTDEHGDIGLETDGKQLWVEVSR